MGQACVSSALVIGTNSLSGIAACSVLSIVIFCWSQLAF